jgi:hypothetical protein
MEDCQCAQKATQETCSGGNQASAPLYSCRDQKAGRRRCHEYPDCCLQAVQSEWLADTSMCILATQMDLDSAKDGNYCFLQSY